MRYSTVQTIVENTCETLKETDSDKRIGDSEHPVTLAATIKENYTYRGQEQRCGREKGLFHFGNHIFLRLKAELQAKDKAHKGRAMSSSGEIYDDGDE